MLILLWALGIIDHAPVVAQTLLPDGVVSGSGWTASDTTLDADTADADDGTYASATSDAAEVVLSLDNPSPSFDQLAQIDVTVRVRKV